MLALRTGRSLGTCLAGKPTRSGFTFWSRLPLRSRLALESPLPGRTWLALRPGRALWADIARFAAKTTGTRLALRTGFTLFALKSARTWFPAWPGLALRSGLARCARRALFAARATRPFSSRGSRLATLSARAGRTLETWLALLPAWTALTLRARLARRPRGTALSLLPLRSALAARSFRTDRASIASGPGRTPGARFPGLTFGATLARSARFTPDSGRAGQPPASGRTRGAAPTGRASGSHAAGWTLWTYAAPPGFSLNTVRPVPGCVLPRVAVSVRLVAAARGALRLSAGPPLLPRILALAFLAFTGAALAAPPWLRPAAFGPGAPSIPTLLAAGAVVGQTQGGNQREPGSGD